MAPKIRKVVMQTHLCNPVLGDVETVHAKYLELDAGDPSVNPVEHTVSAGFVRVGFHFDRLKFEAVPDILLNSSKKAIISWPRQLLADYAKVIWKTYIVRLDLRSLNTLNNILYLV